MKIKGTPRQRLEKKIALINSRKYKSESIRKHSIMSATNQVYLQELRERKTQEENLVQLYLELIGVRYIFQKGFFKPFHRIVDFYIPKKKVIIEVDGGYHNDIVAKDAHKDFTWQKMGYKTVRITNDEVLNGSFKQKLRFLTLF